MNVAANKPVLLTLASAFDVDKMKLNCLSGGGVLAKGRLLQRDPSDLIFYIFHVKSAGNLHFFKR